MSKLFPVTVTVNGQKYSREVEARMLLSDFLRHELGSDGHACWLRARHMRRLHHHFRWRGGPFLFNVCCSGERARISAPWNRWGHPIISIPCRNPSPRSMRCNAAFAPRVS